MAEEPSAPPPPPAPVELVAVVPDVFEVVLVPVVPVEVVPLVVLSALVVEVAVPPELESSQAANKTKLTTALTTNPDLTARKRILASP